MTQQQFKEKIKQRVNVGYCEMFATYMMYPNNQQLPEWVMNMETLYINRKDDTQISKIEWIQNYVFNKINNTI